MIIFLDIVIFKINFRFNADKRRKRYERNFRIRFRSCSKIWKIFLIFYDRNIREIEREVLLTFIFKVDSKLEIRK